MCNGANVQSNSVSFKLFRSVQNCLLLILETVYPWATARVNLHYFTITKPTNNIGLRLITYSRYLLVFYEIMYLQNSAYCMQYINKQLIAQPMQPPPVPVSIVQAYNYTISQPMTVEVGTGRSISSDYMLHSFWQNHYKKA